jgi:hypothetical protein
MAAKKKISVKVHEAMTIANPAFLAMNDRGFIKWGTSKTSLV